MTITKYLHSCLHILLDSTSLLIDPGEYSVNENAITIDTLSNLNYLLITHEHQDHLSLTFIRKLINKFPSPDNIRFSIGNILTHPGDSYQFSDSTAVLAMPMIAPWGSLVDGLTKILEVRPKKVIPIHDWHWKDSAKAAIYPRVTEYLRERNIEFIIPETGKPFEV